MEENKDLLGGLISEKTALEYTEAQWRVIQFKFMCGLQDRMLSLEHKIGWRTLFMGIPWLIVGGMITLILKGVI